MQTERSNWKKKKKKKSEVFIKSEQWTIDMLYSI